MKSLYDKISEDIQKRNLWEQKIQKFYRMRHDGERRKKREPWQADMHYPLIDGSIEKHKPFYFQQLYGTELIASFVSLKEQDNKSTMLASQWFDWSLKQKSNLEMEMLTCIDHMLLSGKGILKIFWDPEKKSVWYRAIDPFYLIVPSRTSELAEADRVCHVQHYSVEAYKRLKKFEYNCDATLIGELLDKSGANSNNSSKDSEKQDREGLTICSDDDTIIVWEVYERKEDDWIVHTFSPSKPDFQLRKTFKVPYLRNGKPFLPFVEFQCEVKDKGYYSSRGLSEILAPHEAALNKNWNEKLDAMTMYNRPLLWTESNSITNTGNLKLVPGQISQFQINRVQMGEPPFSFDQEMINTRMVAEYRAGMPDFGLGQQTNQGKSRTATEVSNITSLMGQNIDLRARIFRKAEAVLFDYSWSILLQYAKESLRFMFDEEMQELPIIALHGDYLIQPNGSSDNYNKSLYQQRAFARFQMFNGDPFIDQGELRKATLEADDPRLVKRLFINAGSQAAMQAEDQADEITRMMIGFPSQVRPNDDDAVHLITLSQFVQRRIKMREGLTAEQASLFLKHGEPHLLQLKKKNPNQYQEVLEKIKPTIEFLQGMIQGAQKAIREQALFSIQSQQQQAPQPIPEEAQMQPEEIAA